MADIERWTVIRDVETVPERPGCYCLLLNGSARYIGQSNNLRRRLREHAWSALDGTVKIRCAKRRGEHLEIENRLIHRLRPPLNLIGHSDAHIIRALRRDPMAHVQCRTGGDGPERVHSLAEVASAWKLPVNKIRELFAGRFVEAIQERTVREVFQKLTSSNGNG